jgi:hypothetical protein
MDNILRSPNQKVMNSSSIFIVTFFLNGIIYIHSEFEKQVIKLGIKEISSKQEILIIHVLDGSWYIRTMIGKCTYGF